MVIYYILIVGGLVSQNKGSTSTSKANEINVVIKNKPEKNETENKIKELSEFLSNTWHMPINSQ